jgi:hypothetical protein
VTILTVRSHFRVVDEVMMMQQPATLDALTDAALQRPMVDAVRGGISGVGGLGSGVGGMHNVSAVGAVGGAPGVATPYGLLAPSPAVATGLPPTEILRSSFKEPLGDILRFMDAVATTNPGNPQEFMAIWGSIGSPATVSDTAVAVKRMLSVPTSHIATVLHRVDPTLRNYLHAQIIDLSERSKDEMPEVAQAAIALQWFMNKLLPDLQAAGLPEDSMLGTTHTLKRNYGEVLRASEAARPDVLNPTCHKLSAEARHAQEKVQVLEQKVAESLRAATEASTQLAARQKRLQDLGFEPAAEPEADKKAIRHLARRELHKKMNALTALAITGFVLFAVVLVVLIAVVIMQASKKRSASAAALLPPAPGQAGASFGGVRRPGSHSVLDTAHTHTHRAPFFGGATSSMPSFELSSEWT